MRQGNTKKFREVDLGEVDPFGEGEGANYICIDCSNQQGKDVLAWEEYIGQYHEDHYDQEITY